MSRIEQTSSRMDLCDSCHGGQVVRGLLWCNNELEAALLIKKSCKQFATVQNIHGITALHVAAAKGWKKMCSWLLRSGADLTAKSENLLTPIEAAAAFGNIETLLLLIKAGDYSRRTSVAIRSAYKELYSNINSINLEPENVPVHPMADIYVQYFGTFLKILELDKEIDTVHSGVPQHRLGMTITPCALTREQICKRSKQHRLDLRSDFFYGTEEDGDDSDDSDEEYELAKISDAQKKRNQILNDGSLIYVFGLNQNFNLGLGTDDRRERPTLLERFTREQAVVDACLTKYHSLYLTASGVVRASGHGVGGRLGTGTEETCVRPEAVKLPPHTRVQMVAAGADHSLFLTAAGEVYGCGLNTHHQLGLSSRASDKFLTPKKIAVPPPKAGSPEPGPVLGVACADYHSVLWTKCHLYTWGTNLGQLGHSDPVVPTPRAVSNCQAFVNSNIYKVSVNNVCTVVAALDGRVIAFYCNKRNVVTKRFSDGEVVLSLSCFGGNFSKIKTLYPASANRLLCHEADLNAPSEIIAKLTDEENRVGESNDELENNHCAEELKILLITSGNIIYEWSDLDMKGKTVSCFFSERSAGEKTLVQIFATPSCVLALSETSHVFRLEFSGYDKSARQCNYRAHSLAYLHRARKIFCDPRGENFAVMTYGSFPKFDIEHNDLHSLVSDMQFLYQNLSEDEFHCDVVLLCEGKRFPAHKLVLAAKSLYFREFFTSKKGEKLMSKEKKTLKITPQPVRCECSFNDCHAYFQVLLGNARGSKTSSDVGSLGAGLHENESNKIETSEISDKPSPNVEKTIYDSMDFAAQDLPTVDVSFMSSDTLKEILHFCYTGLCEKYSDYLRCLTMRFLDLNIKSDMLEDSNDNSNLPSEWLEHTRTSRNGERLKLAKVYNHLKKHLAYEDGDEWDESVLFEEEKLPEGQKKSIDDILTGVQALKIENFAEDCKLHPDPNLLRSLSTGLDVQFEAPDGTLGPKAHLFILCLRVPYFETLLSTRWAKKSYSTEGLLLVRTPHCHSPAFLMLLQCLYCGSFCSCNLTVPLLQDLITISDELLVSSARTLAEKHLVDFIDRRSWTSLYQFSVNFNCQLLRQHILFFLYYDTPLMIESRWTEILRPEDLNQISYMNWVIAFRRKTSRFYLAGRKPRKQPACYYLPSELGETGSKSRKLFVNYEEKVVVEKQMFAMAVAEEFSLGYKNTEEDPMRCLENRLPQCYSELMQDAEDMRIRLDSEDFKPPKGEVEIPSCPYIYHTHEQLCEHSHPCGTSGLSSWRNRRVDLLSRERSDDDDEFSFDGLVERTNSDKEDDANPWHVVGRRHNAASTEPLPKMSDLLPIANDRRDEAETSIRGCSLFATLDYKKRKHSNVGIQTSTATTRRKSKRAQRSSKVSTTSGASTSSCDEESTADAQYDDDDEACKLDGVADAQSNYSSHDEAAVSDEVVASVEEKPAIFTNEFPSLAESVTAAAQQQLQTPKPVALKQVPPFVRTSQKQRRKLMREQKEAEAQAASATPAVPKTPTPAWGLATSSDAPAEHQPEFDFPSLRSGRVRRTSQRTLSSSSGGSDFGVGSPQSPSNFSAIMQREKTMKENYEKSQRKSLEHIQMEERAIAELEQYYGALAGHADTITVTRYSAPQSLPLWTEKHRPRHLS